MGWGVQTLCSQSQSASSVQPSATSSASILSQQNISSSTMPPSVTKSLSSSNTFIGASSNSEIENDLTRKLVSSSSFSDISSILSPPPTSTSSNYSFGMNYDWLLPTTTISPSMTNDRRGAELPSLATSSALEKNSSFSACRYQQSLIPAIGSGSTENFMSMFNSNGLGPAEAALSRVASNFVDSTTCGLQQNHNPYGNSVNNTMYGAAAHYSAPGSMGSVGSSAASVAAVAAAAAAATVGPSYHLPGHGLPSPTIYPPTPPPSAPWIHPWYAGDTF